MPSEPANPLFSQPSGIEPFPPTPDPTAGQRRSILERWDITVDELTQLIDENPSMRGIVIGYVAELKLKKLFEAHEHISKSFKYDDHDRTRKSDRVIVYRGKEFSVEAKSLQTNSVKQIGGKFYGKTQVDGSDKREVVFSDGSKLVTTNLLRNQFDILAVNLFAFEKQWRFSFALNADLPPCVHKKYTESQRKMLLPTLIPVTWPPEPPFVADPFELVERLYKQRYGG